MRLLILAFTLIFILVIFIFLFISNRNRHRNELLKTEVKNKNDELTRLALHISGKNQLVQDLSSKIKESEGLEDNKQIYLRIANIIQSDKESEYFHNEVNAFLAKFRNKLNTIYDNLKEKDLRLCALIQLGLSSKEIANIFNISSKSVDMQRYRLRKKIGIPQNVSIEEWLNKIDEKP